MCLILSALFNPLLCHLQHVLWSLPSSMFLSISVYGCAGGCVCWNYVVWVFMAFAVSQALSVSFSPRVVYCVCVCCIEGLISLTAHSLSYTHNAHICVRTQWSQDILLHTLTMLTFFLKCLQTLKYLLPLQVMHDLI